MRLVDSDHLQDRLIHGRQGFRGDFHLGKKTGDI
jgi:hypothetical protein